MSVDCCNPECIPNILKINEMKLLNNNKSMPNPTYSNFDENILPDTMYSDIINRNKNKVLSVCELNPLLYSQVGELEMKLRMAGDMASRNLLGCCHRLPWTPHSGKKILSFNNLININRYRTRYHRTSHLSWFINTVINGYKKHELAKHYISNNKYYPANNLVINKDFHYLNKYDKIKTNGEIKHGCNKLKKLDYINWLKYRNIINCKKN
jgi:hypothetical protein